MESEPVAPAQPPLRGRAAEARQNDDAVLEAARTVFAERGFDVPISAIAERAGVGVASIYRRYPNKDRLVLALRLHALRQVIDMAHEVAVPVDGSAVRRFLERHLREASSPLVTTFGKHVPRSPEVDAAAEELRTALESVIAQDRELGLVPEDYGPGELMIAITHLRPLLPTDKERAIELHLRQLDHYLLGLDQRRAGRSVRGAPMTWEEWVSLNSSD